MINDVFPHKVCVNLDRRADRWQQMQTKFERLGIDGVRRVAAIDGQQLQLPTDWSDSPGAYGCLLSHLQVVREARAQGQEAVLIFEDDVAFDERLQDRFTHYFSQLPQNWDMLYFGALHLEEPAAISENVYQVRRANSTFAYALRHTIFDAFIELNSATRKPVDVSNRDLHASHACYCFLPHLAWVEDVPSDVQEREKYHWYLQESLVIHGSTMDHMLKHTSLIVAYQNPGGSKSIRENLIFLSRFYGERLGINVIIVEQGTQPTVSAEQLASGCQYFLLEDDGPFNKARCFNIGMEMTDPDQDFMIFSDSNIFVEEWDIRGQLRMCQRYDCTTGFGRLVDLTDHATLTLQGNRPMLLTPWFNAAEYASQQKNDPFGQLCIFNRRSIEAAGGWLESTSEETAGTPPLRTRRPVSSFAVPNDALQLYGG